MDFREQLGLGDDVVDDCLAPRLGFQGIEDDIEVTPFALVVVIQIDTDPDRNG